MKFDGQYLTYTEYVNLGGTLKQMPFNIAEYKARKQIDEATFGRLINLESQNQDVKMCMYELINEASKDEKQGTKSSESIDGYSVTYNSADTKEQQKKYNNIIREYLIEDTLEDGTPYLYCGVDS